MLPEIRGASQCRTQNCSGARKKQTLQAFARILAPYLYLKPILVSTISRLHPKKELRKNRLAEYCLLRGKSIYIRIHMYIYIYVYIYIEFWGLGFGVKGFGCRV